MKRANLALLFRRNRTTNNHRRAQYAFEQLESRRVLAASAAFNLATGALTVSDGSPTANTIAIGFQISGGQTVVSVTDGGVDILPGDVQTNVVKSITVAVAGGNDTVSLSFVAPEQYTQLFQSPVVDGGEGDDTIFGSKIVDALFGVGGNDKILGLEAGDHLYGGEGNDQIFGDYGSNNAPNSGNDFLYAEAGNDLLFGDQGVDNLFGFAGNDQLSGNDGDDLVFGNEGDDRMIWNPGDDTDLNEGGGGTDTTEVNGGSGAEVFTTTANGTRVRFDRLNPAPFSIDIGTTENLVVNASGGDDNFSATGNLARPDSDHGRWRRRQRYDPRLERHRFTARRRRQRFHRRPTG